MRRVGRSALVAVPVWLALLLLLPLTGGGPLISLSGATVLTLGVVVWADRRYARGELRGAPTRAAGSPRPPMSARAAAGLTLGGAVLLAYIVFVVVTGVRGS